MFAQFLRNTVPVWMIFAIPEGIGGFGPTGMGAPHIPVTHCGVRQKGEACPKYLRGSSTRLRPPPSPPRFPRGSRPPGELPDGALRAGFPLPPLGPPPPTPPHLARIRLQTQARPAPVGTGRARAWC